MVTNGVLLQVAKTIGSLSIVIIVIPRKFLAPVWHDATDYSGWRGVVKNDLWKLSSGCHLKIIEGHGVVSEIFVPFRSQSLLFLALPFFS